MSGGIYYQPQEADPPKAIMTHNTIMNTRPLQYKAIAGPNLLHHDAGGALQLLEVLLHVLPQLQQVLRRVLVLDARARVGVQLEVRAKILVVLC